MPDDGPALLRARLAKEAVHELGHTFGLLHCPDHGCVMARSATLSTSTARRMRCAPTAGAYWKTASVEERHEARERTRILVVDDEEIVRESLLAGCPEGRLHVATAPDGPTALARLGEAEPWSHPARRPEDAGMDGLQVLEEARKRQPGAAVVIMTAYATVDTAVTAMKLGAYDYIVEALRPRGAVADDRRRSSRSRRCSARTCCCARCSSGSTASAT